MSVSLAFLTRCAAETGFRQETLEKVVRLGEVAEDTDGGDTLVRMRGARRMRDVRRLPAVTALFEPVGFLSIHQSHTVNLRRVRELRPRDEGDGWEVKLDPPVDRMLPVVRGELARLEAAFGEGG